MTIKECYEIMGENYNDVLARLQIERLVIKYALKFLDDPTYEMITVALKEKDYATAYRASHTLKGICANLGFSKLGNVSANLSDALKEKRIKQVEVEFLSLKDVYENTVSLLKKYQNSL